MTRLLLAIAVATAVAYSTGATALAGAYVWTWPDGAPYSIATKGQSAVFLIDGTSARYVYGRPLMPVSVTPVHVDWTLSAEHTTTDAAVRDAFIVAWSSATGGRSVIVNGEGFVSVRVLFDNALGTSNRSGYFLTGGRITVYQQTADAMVRALVHETGHALGCCWGGGAGTTTDGHLVCPPDQIMCPYLTPATRFTDQELVLMGLILP